MAKFQNRSDFNNATFVVEAGFNMVQILGATNFYQANIASGAYFGITKITEFMSSTKVSFQSALNIRRTQMSTIILEGTSLGQNARLNMKDMDI